MLTEKEFETIAEHSTASRLTKKALLEYIQESFVGVVPTKVSTRVSTRNCINPAKKSTDLNIIGHDEDGNPIRNTQRQEEIKGGYKVRRKGESERNDANR